MKVFIVVYISRQFDETAVEMVFDSYKKAEEYIEKEQPYYSGDYEIVEKEVK